MVRRRHSQLAEIESDALDESVSVATALRKCVALGGKSGSAELRDWATRELKGYPNLEDLPEYRTIAAPLRVDGISGNYKVTGEELPPIALPDFAQEHISNDLPLNQGVAELENLARQPEIRLAPPHAADLALYMNSQGHTGAYGRINSIYWQVSPVAINGVLDQIRTALTQLVAEMTAAMPTDEDVPSAAAADNAVQVVVSGKRHRVTVNAAQAAGERSNSSVDPEPVKEAGFWTTSKKVGGFLVGLATVVAAVVAVTQIH